MSSCTAGLMLAIRALELPAGAEVIVPSFTFAATAQALVWNGLVPVFCGCVPDSLTLDPADVESNLSPRTAAICPVYVYGLSPEIDALLDVGARHGLPVYFDSAQGLGSEYRGRPAGTFGKCEVFSPSPTKVVTAAEGGVICTGDPSLAARLRSMRDYGKDPAEGEDMVYLGVSLPQVFQVKNGTWRNLTSAELGMSYYPWMFLAPNDKIFSAGQDETTRCLDTYGNQHVELGRGPGRPARSQRRSRHRPHLRISGDVRPRESPRDGR
jgi:dTDP-4-amino-4,6-dideoxygalactose transaminase